MDLDKIKLLPLGFSEVIYKQSKYGVTRSDFNRGKSIKIFAEQLGGNDFVSFNLYLTTNGVELKPCEMPKNKVLEFLEHFVLIEG